MFKQQDLITFIGISLILTACQTTGSHLSKSDQATSLKLAKTVPIADLHDHDDFASSVREETGVLWSGMGSRTGYRYAWMLTKKHLGDQRIAWAGQKELNDAYRSGGISEMLNPNNPSLKEMVEQSEKDLKDGLIAGFGEILINNRTSNKNPSVRRKGPVDAPFIKKLFNLVGKYDGFLALHTQADSDSMEQLDNLLASNRKGRIVLAHCGTDSSASDIRSLMDKHPNLFCDLSFRSPPMNKNYSREVFSSSGINSSWRQLIEDHSDRFMVGTDAHTRDEFVKSIKIVRDGLLPDLTPATLKKVAFQNAKRLFRLKDVPGS